MLATHHNQENVYTHQTGASKQQLQAKTPGARYPKTPLKVPLNDENTHHGFGGKSVLRTKGNNENIVTIGRGGKSGKANMVTPAGSRTVRAPLGNKTTNAKAKATQQASGVKDIVSKFEKTIINPGTTARPKQAAPQVESSKLEVHTDRSPLDDDEDVEYAPPNQKDIPYQSDILPEGGLTFEGLKPENMFKGYYQYYFNQVDDNGMSAKEREMEEQRQKTFKRGDEQIMKDMEEFDWSVGDVPSSKDFFKVKKDATGPEAVSETKKTTRMVTKPPTTIASRSAAAALAMPSKPRSTSQTRLARPNVAPATKPRSFLASRQKPAQTAVIQPTTSSRERVTAAAASRSTLGYSKGRSAVSVVYGRNEPVTRQAEAPIKTPRALTRSLSTMSSGSDTTITPARFAQTQVSQDWKKPEFLSIFDLQEDDDGNLGNAPALDDFDDDFQLSTDF
ncbi:hypothetical protein B0H67DRAFT_576473 [Lasiosphaeris hirsuta]|uniref:Uncharacterized protein n=1 Tax=Lasiosphaeris hirsuta TaxID=260670 RepID=A0AA40AR65_9PEZI|nr:hypothetical protein B0H67DRAFT_576473 [Lasiosphaeris hirsuta]